MSKTVCLQGEPGSGKTRMMCETAVNQPVHVLDIDRKLASAAWAAPLLANGSLTYWELAEAIDDTNLLSRIRSLSTKVTNEGPGAPPKGWERFANMVYDLPKKEESKRAGTWGIDSATILNEHLKTHIMYLTKRSKFTFDQWNALKVGWMDTFSVLRDLAREHGKDLIVTVHERWKEEPGDRTTGVRMEAVKSGDDVILQKAYQGTQDVKVWASIDGAFGDLIGAQCDEYYWLYVKMSGDRPEWRCRVWPDGRRSLRTSFNVKQAEFAPDFREIWK